MFVITDHNESENKKAEVLGGISRLCALFLAFPRQNSYCRAARQDGTACARADGSLRLGVRSCFTAGLTFFCFEKGIGNRPWKGRGRDASGCGGVPIAVPLWVVRMPDWVELFCCYRADGAMRGYRRGDHIGEGRD